MTTCSLILSIKEWIVLSTNYFICFSFWRNRGNILRVWLYQFQVYLNLHLLISRKERNRNRETKIERETKSGPKYPIYGGMSPLYSNSLIRSETPYPHPHLLCNAKYWKNSQNILSHLSSWGTNVGNNSVCEQSSHQFIPKAYFKM